MAAQSEGGGKDDLKTHFVTREGLYKLMPLSEYSKPTRVGYNGQANPPVKVSFVNVDDGSSSPDRLCFNVGRELYVYVYKGVRKVSSKLCTHSIGLFSRGVLFECNQTLVLANLALWSKYCFWV